MKPTFLILMILVVAACSSAAPNQQARLDDEADLNATDLERIHEGVPAPDFTLESSKNDPVTLSSYQGKKNVVLVFYRGYW